MEKLISRACWSSVFGLRRTESGLAQKTDVKFIKVVGHLFLWVLSWESC